MLCLHSYNCCLAYIDAHIELLLSVHFIINPDHNGYDLVLMVPNHLIRVRIQTFNSNISNQFLVKECAQVLVKCLKEYTC